MNQFRIYFFLLSNRISSFIFKQKKFLYIFTFCRITTQRRQMKNIFIDKAYDFIPSRKDFYYMSPLIKVEEDVQQVDQIEMEGKISPQKNNRSFNEKNQEVSLINFLSNSSNQYSLGILKSEKIKKNYLQDFIYQKTIGKGSFGKVQKLKYNHVQRYVAAKVITKIPGQTASQKGKLKRLENEIQIYRKISHPNITQLISIYEWKREITLIMELSEGQKLNHLIKQHPNEEQNIAKIMYQIFDALQYLSKINIVHRDIKAENILFDERTQIIKIVDFGQAIQLKNQNQKQKYHLGGTFPYFAPQSFNYEFSHKTDTWACGVLLFYLLSTKLIFLQGGKQKQNIKDKILNKSIVFQNNFWNQRSAEVKKLILELLERDPAKRLSAYEAKNSKWIKQNVGNWRPTFISYRQNLINKKQPLQSQILKKQLNQNQKLPHNYKQLTE